MIDVPKLLSPAGAAQLLGVGVSRIQQLSREGLLSEIRDSGNRRIYKEADVLALAKKRRAAKAVSQ